MKPLIDKIKKIECWKKSGIVRSLDYEVKDNSFDSKEFEEIYNAKIEFIKLSLASMGSNKDRSNIACIHQLYQGELVLGFTNVSCKASPIQAYFASMRDLEAAISKIGEKIIKNIVISGV